MYPIIVIFVHKNPLTLFFRTWKILRENVTKPGCIIVTVPSLEEATLFNNKVRLPIAHFTVTVGNEAGVDPVLIQPCLLYYVNHVFVILNSIFFSKIYIRKGRRCVSKQGHPQSHVHSKARTPSPQL